MVSSLQWASVNIPAIRAMVCARLYWLGITLDEDTNTEARPIISAPQSRIEARVTPTNEEAMIAHYTLDTVRPLALAD